MKTKCLSLLLVGILSVLISFIIWSPHLKSASGVFSLLDPPIGWTELNTKTKQNLVETSIETADLYRELHKYLMELDPSLVDTDISDLNIDLFSWYLANTKQQLTADEKGQILGKYPLLPAEWMNLVLYQREETPGIFGLESLAEDLAEETANYSIEAQSKLSADLTVFYGYDALKSLYDSEDSFYSDQTRFIQQNAGLELNILPGMLLNADYQKTLETSGSSKAQKTLQLFYDPGPFASVNAGYGIITKDPNPFDIDMFPTWFTDFINQEKTPEMDDIIITQLGLAVQPTVFSKLSADYVLTEGTTDAQAIKKTMFGLTLGDDQTELSATYQLKNQENQTTTSTGLELGLIDLAKIKAVYSYIENQEDSDTALESIVDLGLDLHLADSSRLRVQYKWVLPEETGSSSDESSAEASLEIRF